jgi:hypothetical protein
VAAASAYALSSSASAVESAASASDAANEATVAANAAVSAFADDLAASSGASLVGYMPAGTGAVATTVQAKLLESVSVLDFGAIGDWAADDTAAINAAVAFACAAGTALYVPAGTYKLIPTTTKTDEAGINVCAIEMFSKLHIVADRGAVFKIADNVSTDAAPIRMSMFFSNQFLGDISITGLTMDMNGQNNPISPARPTTYNLFTNAPFIFSGTPGGVAAGANRVRLIGNRFINIAGVSGIVMSQSNTAGVVLSDDWVIENNEFYNVGLDTIDHSTLYLTGTNVTVRGNWLHNPLAHNPTTGTGGLCAIELHASNQIITENIIENYSQGFWLSVNMTEPVTSNFVISNNKVKVSYCFADCWSQNLLPYGVNEGFLNQISITGNVIEISADAVVAQIKAFMKFGARKQPAIIDFSNNVCRSYDTAKDTVLCLAQVGTNQQAILDQAVIRNNTCSGLSVGLVCYFNGDGYTSTTQNMGRVTFEHNELGYLLASAVGYPAADVYLYGPSAGVVDALRLAGLQTPDTPVAKDAAVGGRATIYGKVIVPVAVTWVGVTVGNGTVTSSISIDTDQQVADINVLCQAGATTTFLGPVYPSFNGVVASANAAAVMVHTKTGLAETVPCFIYATANYLSTMTAAGGAFGSGQTLDGVSRIAATVRFPARKIVI